MPPVNPDLAIIGGGILGAVLAHEAVDLGYRPVVFRMSDQQVPFGDSFRNQAWLQSGLRYVRHNPQLAAHMWTYGRRLHEAIGLPVPDGRGVFQLEPADEQSFLEDARALGINNDIESLSPERARQLLGDHYESTLLHYSTPESPFDEAKVIRRARERAERYRAVFCDLTKPVEIVSRKGKSPSHRLQVNGKEMEFAATVLAAGAGNIPLLESLKNQVQIKIEQTPLLVMPGPPTIEAPILVKRTKGGFSLVAHTPGPTRTNGCMVFAADVTEEIDAYHLPSKRRVSPHKKQELLAAVPTTLKSRLSQSRVTAGWELSVVRDAVKQHTTKPFVEFAREHGDIVIAMPGRATLSLYAVELVVEHLRRTKSSKHRSPVPPNAPWNASNIRMHHEEYYDQRLNDA